MFFTSKSGPRNGSAVAPTQSLKGIRILLVFQAFRQDQDTFAFLTTVRNLGAIPPLNLLYTATWLKSAGAEVTLLDANAHQWSLSETISRAQKAQFDLVGFTVTNLDFLFAINWIREFHSVFNKPIFVGGIAAENYPEEMAAFPEITAVFHSPAETCVVEWLTAYVGGKAWHEVPGTCVRWEDKIHLNKAAPLPPGFVRPHPDRSLLSDPMVYHSLMARDYPFTAGMSVFGCPYPCDFCAIRRMPLFIRSAEDVVGEMEVCEKEFGIREIDYFDSNFTVPRERIFRMAELYRRKGLKLRWSARVRVDRVDRDVLAAMKSMNCRWIGFGLESASEVVLGNISKNLGGRARVMENLKMTRAAGIDTVGLFVLGLPGENERTLRETIDFMLQADLDYVQISPYWPIPRTPIYENIVRKTGIDIWRLVITQGAQSDMPLLDTDFTMGQLYEAASEGYGEFYFRPRQIAKEFRRMTDLRELSKRLRAGIDIFRGILPSRAGCHS